MWLLILALVGDTSFSPFEFLPSPLWFFFPFPQASLLFKLFQIATVSSLHVHAILEFLQAVICCGLLSWTPFKMQKISITQFDFHC
jgi:hypothetical protein